MLTTLGARAYVSWGRWVAACPNSTCNNAEELHPWHGYPCGHRECSIRTFPESTFHCSLCQILAPVDWPINAMEIWSVLGERPNVPNRNWFPEDHELAVTWNLPHGQTVSELRDEHRAMVA